MPVLFIVWINTVVRSMSIDFQGHLSNYKAICENNVSIFYLWYIINVCKSNRRKKWKWYSTTHFRIKDRYLFAWMQIKKVDTSWMQGRFADHSLSRRLRGTEGDLLLVKWIYWDSTPLILVFLPWCIFKTRFIKPMLATARPRTRRLDTARWC